MLSSAAIHVFGYIFSVLCHSCANLTMAELSQTRFVRAMWSCCDEYKSDAVDALRDGRWLRGASEGRQETCLECVENVADVL
ncbi:hypothetical protein CERSUDRAFT_113285 [Gelatoporia subvermispora B]|uniref:Uncharacterized protein n=1 Tax=Ceriporiopsis subvermispora (strain B) TaxID=914234 RepID=M2PNW5_CERS8|nr:hypothetical protein CERSUDRAFT_113285 [Gelatoporia subvermispora B]